MRGGAGAELAWEGWGCGGLARERLSSRSAACWTWCCCSGWRICTTARTSPGEADGARHGPDKPGEAHGARHGPDMPWRQVVAGAILIIILLPLMVSLLGLGA